MSKNWKTLITNHKSSQLSQLSENQGLFIYCQMEKGKSMNPYIYEEEEETSMFLSKICTWMINQLSKQRGWTRLQ